MKLRLIATAVIAALLLTGCTFSAPQSNSGGVTQPASGISQEAAETTALAHAGASRQEDTGLQSHRDRDDGIPEWDVEFRHGDWEYDYTVHAETGEILEWGKDFEPLKTPDPSQTGMLTGEEAATIALSHAGIPADQAQALRTQLDTEDTPPEWDVEFRSNGWEYEYEIHAQTGEILRSEKETDG